MSKKRKADETMIFKENVEEVAAPAVKKVKINNGTAVNYIERNKQMIVQAQSNIGFAGAFKNLMSTATKRLGIPSNFGFGSCFRP